MHRERFGIKGKKQDLGLFRARNGAALDSKRSVTCLNLESPAHALSAFPTNQFVIVYFSLKLHVLPRYIQFSD